MVEEDLGRCKREGLIAGRSPVAGFGEFDLKRAAVAVAFFRGQRRADQNAGGVVARIVGQTAMRALRWCRRVMGRRLGGDDKRQQPKRRKNGDLLHESLPSRVIDG